jgi:hypothetical protein
MYGNKFVTIAKTLFARSTDFEAVQAVSRTLHSEAIPREPLVAALLP